MKWILSICFVSGIVLAGSDGAWFPWVNLLGVSLIGLVGIITNIKTPSEY